MSAWRRPEPGLLIIAIALLAATYSGPSLRLERPTYRYLFVFDITQSMNVMDLADLEPGLTRLEFAKRMAGEALSELPCGAEAGLALFTGHRAFALLTPIEICANYSEILTMVGNLDWRMTWEARSEIAKGLYKSIELADAMGEQTRLVFITDGHEAPPIRVGLPPRYGGEIGQVKGLIVGVGGAVPVPIPKLDEHGKQLGYWQANEVLQVDAFTHAAELQAGRARPVAGSEHLSALREGYLRELGARTGLDYYRLTDAAQFARQLRGAALAIPKVVDADLRWLYAAAALAVFAASLLVPAARVYRARASGRRARRSTIWPA